MFSVLRSKINLLLAAVIAVSLSACAAQGSAPEQGDYLLEAHGEGRIHIFYDKKTYTEFLQLGETSYRLTRIGAGPKGETIVFGLTSQDKNKRGGIPAVEIFDGNRRPASFYGEMRRESRIYVFNNYDDMKAVRDTGHAAYRYTDIAAGPNGETVVYVLNSNNKKKKPVELIATYQAFHATH